MIGGQEKELRLAGCVLAILPAGAAIVFAQGTGVINGTVEHSPLHSDT